MHIAVFNTKPYDKEFLTQANHKHGYKLTFFDVHLNHQTCSLAQGYDVVCSFVNDKLTKGILNSLSKSGVKLIALRCAGFNQVDIKTALELGITIARVPAYSPHGVAEHAVALMLALNRKIYRAYNRVRDGNFSLDGMMGFNMNEKTVGIIGTGKIGFLLAKILSGFSCQILAYDIHENPECLKLGVKYVSLDTLYAQSDIISLHTPLIPQTHHMIGKESLSQMKDGVMIINTSRGGLIDTNSIISFLKSGKIGYLGLDVYEEEEALFFDDLSSNVIKDDTFSRLLTFPNVLITGHQAFFTDTALRNIAETTLENISAFSKGELPIANIVGASHIKTH